MAKMQARFAFPPKTCLAALAEAVAKGEEPAGR